MAEQLQEILQSLGTHLGLFRNAQHPRFVVRFDPPLYQLDFPTLDLNPSYAAGMDATADVEIERFSHLGEHGAMGVTTDDHLIVVRGDRSLYPPDDLLFNFSPFFEILGWAGRIFDSKHLKRLPDISDKKPAEPPKAIAQQISLMSVDDKDAIARVRMSKN